MKNICVFVLYHICAFQNLPLTTSLTLKSQRTFGKGRIIDQWGKGFHDDNNLHTNCHWKPIHQKAWKKEISLKKGWRNVSCRLAVLIFLSYCAFLTNIYFPPRLWTNYVTIVVKKYLPQTQEIKDVVQDLISAGIPNFMYNKYTSGFSGKTVYLKI